MFSSHAAQQHTSLYNAMDCIQTEGNLDTLKPTEILRPDPCQYRKLTFCSRMPFLSYIGTRKLGLSVHYCVVFLHNATFTQIYTILVCDRQTDKQTHDDGMWLVISTLLSK